MSLFIIVIILAEVGPYFTPTWVWRCQTDDLSTETEPSPLTNEKAMGKEFPVWSKVLEKFNSGESTGQEAQYSLMTFFSFFPQIIKKRSCSLGSSLNKKEQNHRVCFPQTIVQTFPHPRHTFPASLTFFFLRAVSFFSNYFFTNQVKPLHSQRALITLYNFIKAESKENTKKYGT